MLGEGGVLPSGPESHEALGNNVFRLLAVLQVGEGDVREPAAVLRVQRREFLERDDGCHGAANIRFIHEKKEARRENTGLPLQ